MDIETLYRSYLDDMGAVKIGLMEPAAAVGVCMAHDGEFVVAKVGEVGIQIGGKKYKSGDRVELDRTQRAARANDFANNRLIPDYVYDARKLHEALKDHFNKVIEPALKKVRTAEQEIRQGEALEIAASAQLDDAKTMQSDGADHLETAKKLLADALKYRPE